MHTHKIGLFIVTFLCLISLAQTQTVIDIIEKDNDLQSFYQKLTSWPNIINYFNDETKNFTMFAPINSAVDHTNFPDGKAMEELLFYHGVPGRVLSLVFRQGLLIPSVLEVPSLNNDTQKLRVTIDDKHEFYINNAKIVVKDITGTRGVVHKIDSVLFPPGNISSFLHSNKQWSTLYSLLDINSMINEVDADTVTLFAPVDAGFDNLGEALLNYLKNTNARDDLRKILTYHLSPSVIYATKIPRGDSKIPTLNPDGQSIEVHRPANFPKGRITLNSGKSTLISVDNLASNGVVHGLDEVLLPEDFSFNLEKLLIGLGLDKFLSYIRQMNLTDILLTKTSYTTILAPSNQAFEHFTPPPDHQFMNLLLYHGIPEYIPSDKIYDGEVFDTMMTLATLGGPQKVKSRVEDSKIYFNNALITNADQYCSNGVIHVINEVLALPPNLLNVLENMKTPRVSTLLHALNRVEVNNTLVKDKLTFFAPSDGAFRKLPLGTLTYLMADREDSYDDLTEILNYHIVPEVVYNDDIKDGVSHLSTFADDGNAKITLNKTAVNEDEDKVVIDDNANVRVFDILGSNGVLHIIDHVLIPDDVDITLAKVAVGLQDTTTLLGALSRVGLDRYLNGEEIVTIFAPTDDAFSKVRGLSDLLNNPNELTHILSNHIHVGPIPNIRQGKQWTMVGGKNIIATSDKTVAFVTSQDSYATIVASTIGKNGYIYVIDAVLGAEQVSRGKAGVTHWEIAVIVLAALLVLVCIIATILILAFAVRRRRRRDEFGYAPINTD